MKIKVVVVSAEPLEVLRLYLEESDKFILSGIVSKFEKVALDDGEKSLVIVDVSMLGAFDFISRIKSENTFVMAISEKPDVDLLVKTMRSGASEFVSLPLIKTEFFSALDKIYADFNDEGLRKSKCRVLSIFSNKGGIGKTSIAANLALELAKITQENVALVDLNFQAGDVTSFFDLKPSFNISYMLENLDKINKDFLLSTLEKFKDSSLYILTDPPYFNQINNVSARQITELLDILRAAFSYVVIDCSAGFDAKVVSALENSDIVIMPVVANLPALRNGQRCLEYLDKLGLAKEKIKVLVNRYMENDEVKIADVESVLGRNIYWKVPNNYFTIMSAINKGLPVFDINPSSNVALSYRDFAIHICEDLYRKSLSENKNGN